MGIEYGLTPQQMEIAEFLDGRGWVSTAEIARGVGREKVGTIMGSMFAKRIVDRRFVYNGAPRRAEWRLL